MTMKLPIKRILIVLVEIAIFGFIGIIAWILYTGGGSFQIHGIVLHAHHIKKPVLLLLFALLLKKLLTGNVWREFRCLQPLCRLCAWCDAFFTRHITACRRKAWKSWSLAVFLGSFLSLMGSHQQMERRHGLIEHYYTNPEHAGTPLVVRPVRQPSLQVIDHDFPATLWNYSARWTGFLYAPKSGEYVFTTVSDDGSALSLDDQLVVDNRGVHGMSERTQTVHLERGLHVMTLDFMQYGGASVFKTYWTSPGKTKTLLPVANLYLKSMTPAKITFEHVVAAGLTVEEYVAGVLLALFLIGRLNPQRRFSTALCLLALGIIGLTIGGEISVLRLLGKTGDSPIMTWLRWGDRFLVLFVSLGIPYRKLKLTTVLQNGLLSGVTFLLCVGLFELCLRTGWFDDKGIIWIQDKYRKVDHEINEKNWEFARQNPFEFTDIIRSEQRPAGKDRLVVLGDSFVWGGAIPYEQAWGHKLERKLTQKYPQLEVVNWGKSGWSTLIELAFLEKEGSRYDLDVLLVGFVRNDPDLGRFKWKLLDVKTLPNKPLQVMFAPFRKLTPNAFEFTTAYLNEFLMNYVLDTEGYGWKAWYDTIYAKPNLREFFPVLEEFAEYCQQRKIRLIFVLTPGSYDAAEGRRMQIMADLLTQAGIEYLNLFPAMVRDLSQYPPRKLWANLADGHPGPLMTELFANETAQYLEQQGILAQLPHVAAANK